MGNNDNDEFEDELSRMRERKSRGRSRSQTKPLRGADRHKNTDRRGNADGHGSADKRGSEDMAAGTGKSGKPKKSKKKIALRVAIIILEVIVLLCIAAYAYVTSKFNKVQRVEDWKAEDIVNVELTPEQKEVMAKGYKTIAVFGVDARDNKQLEKGTHSDVIMICNINMDTGEIQLVSVFRDTYLNISDKNTYRKINAAYFDGGPKQAVKALNKNLDLNIEDYVTFNWKAVAMGINILGGVDIEVNSKELRYLNAFITETVNATGIGSTQIPKPGVIHMDGIQAVAYGRLRLMDSDYVRTERQKIVVKAAFEKAKKANLAKLNELAGNMLEQVSTSLDWNDLIPLMENVSKLYLGESRGFPMARGEMRYKGGDYVVPQTLESNVTELHKFLYGNENYQPTETLKKISAHIADVSGFKTPGKNAGSVVIGGGSDDSGSKSTTAAKKDETKEANSDHKETVNGGADEAETDEDGKPVYSTDEDGKPIRPTDEDGKPIQPTYPTDEDGKPIQPTYQTDEDGKPIRPTYPMDENGRPIYPTHEDGKPIRPTDEDGKPIGPESGTDGNRQPGAAGRPSKDPSESNGDLIYKEPSGPSSNHDGSGIYEEPGKPATSKQDTVPGGGDKRPSGPIISSDAPSDRPGKAPQPSDSQKTESSSEALESSKADKTKESTEADKPKESSKADKPKETTKADKPEESSKAEVTGNTGSGSGSVLPGEMKPSDVHENNNQDKAPIAPGQGGGNTGVDAPGSGRS